MRKQKLIQAVLVGAAITFSTPSWAVAEAGGGTLVVREQMLSDIPLKQQRQTEIIKLIQDKKLGTPITVEKNHGEKVSALVVTARELRSVGVVDTTPGINDGCIVMANALYTFGRGDINGRSGDNWWQQCASIQASCEKGDQSSCYQYNQLCNI